MSLLPVLWQSSQPLCVLKFKFYFTKKNLKIITITCDVLKFMSSCSSVNLLPICCLCWITCLSVNFSMESHELLLNLQTLFGVETLWWSVNNAKHWQSLCSWSANLFFLSANGLCLYTLSFSTTAQMSHCGICRFNLVISKTHYSVSVNNARETIGNWRNKLKWK